VVATKVEEKKVEEAPKKLQVADVFKAQPKQPEFPLKKAPTEVPKKIDNNPFAA
jgi:hypothetical protein